MSLLVNSAGGSAADPILKNLGLEWVISASTMDVATFVDAWVDQAAGFAGTNSVKSSLSPAATVITSGNNASYNDTTKNLTISSTTGLVAGDYLYLSHASITAGIYKISSVVNGTDVSIVSNPFNGLGNKTGVAYQVAWRYLGTAGTAPINSGASGQIDYFKAQVADSVGNNTQLSDTAYVRDAPSGSSFIVIDGKSYTGSVTLHSTPSFDLLPGWASRGGVAYVELANHSVQARNDFKWGDGTITEKTLSAALTSGFQLTAGDGTKYGKILLKSASGAVVTYGVDIDITLDSTGPTLAFSLKGR